MVSIITVCSTSIIHTPGQNLSENYIIFIQNTSTFKVSSKKSENGTRYLCEKFDMTLTI